MSLAGPWLRREIICTWIAVALLVAWPLLPAIQQDQAYHRFADARSLFGIPNAADVLSNLPFALAATLGLVRLRRPIPGLASVTRRSLAVFFTGLLLTTAGSAWYHLHPDDRSLVWDRLPMTVAFAGVLSAVISQRVSGRMATPALYALLAAGLGSVLYWAEAGSLSPYIVIQFGGLLAVVGLLVLARNRDDTLPWGQVLIWYGAAKVLESADSLVWTATNGIVAGHALKHLAAAGAGFALASALKDTKKD